MQRLNGCGARPPGRGPRTGLGCGEIPTPHSSTLHRLDWFFTFRFLAAQVLSFPPGVLSASFSQHNSAFVVLDLSLFVSFRPARSLRSPPFFTDLSCQPLDEKKEVTGEEGVDGRARERMRLNIYLNGNRFWARVARIPPHHTYRHLIHVCCMCLRGAGPYAHARTPYKSAEVNRAGGRFHVCFSMCARVRANMHVTSTR